MSGARSGRLVRVLLAPVALVLLAACSGPAAPPSTRLDVATPQLRAAKQRAHLPDCPATPGGIQASGSTGGTARGGLPAVTLPCLGGGRPVRMAALRGPLVVNLWAQWCGPCRTELPAYAAFARRHRDRVGVLGVDWQDTQPAAAIELARRSGVRYPLVADPDTRIHGDVLPRVLLVDRRGRVAYQQAVEIHGVGQLERLVRRHLPGALS